MNSPHQPPTAPINPEPDVKERLSQDIQREIGRLQQQANRGLWALALFLLVCMFAWRGFPLLPPPDRVMAMLGKPPSPQIISIALLIYTFSAIILSLSRMTMAMEHRSSFSHVGYLTGFFLFYHYAKALDDNYWAVIGAGITVLGVESYRIWSYCNEAIAKKREDLEYIRKTGRMPIEE
jgi:hypothetical protein